MLGAPGPKQAGKAHALHSRQGIRGRAISMQQQDGKPGTPAVVPNVIWPWLWLVVSDDWVPLRKKEYQFLELASSLSR